MNRRDFLTAALGSVVAASACRRDEPRATYGGRLLGQSADVGHLLRKAAIAGPPETTTKVGVAILGAGPSGLSAAWRLARAGITDFTVLELEPQVGGTSTAGPGYPWGAHYIPVPPPENRSLGRLLNELGALDGVDDHGKPVGAEHVLCRAPEERLFYKGTWYEGLYLRAGASHEDVRQFHAFLADMRAWSRRVGADGRPAFALPVSRCTRDPEILSLDRQTMAQYLASKGWTSSRLQWLVDYACRDDFGLRAPQTSAWAGIHYFVSRLDASGESADLLTWPEGNGRVVRHLAESAGPRLRNGSLVIALEPRESSVLVKFLDVASGRVHALEADRVVAALPKFVLGRLVPEVAIRMADWTFGSWIVANIGLRDRPTSRGIPGAWDNVLYDSASLGYVVSTHQLGRDHGPTTWTWYLPLTGDAPKDVREELLRAPWERWSDAVVADLARAHVDFTKHLESIDVWRWGHAMVRPTPGFLAEGARFDVGRPLGRIHLAHADLSGIALFEEAHDHGVRAAEEVLAARGVSFESFR